MVEQLAFNQLVEGSNPSRPTILKLLSYKNTKRHALIGKDNMHPKALENIRLLDEKSRYAYLIRHIADSGELYLIADDEENWAYLGDGKNEYLPVWADECFAQEYAEAHGASVFAYALADFLREGIPFLLEENISIAAFPLTAGSYAVADAKTFAANLNFQLDEDYGEALDLPYL